MAHPAYACAWLPCTRAEVADSLGAAFHGFWRRFDHFNSHAYRELVARTRLRLPSPVPRDTYAATMTRQLFTKIALSTGIAVGFLYLAFRNVPLADLETALQ